LIQPESFTIFQLKNPLHRKLARLLTFKTLSLNKKYYQQFTKSALNNATNNKILGEKMTRAEGGVQAVDLAVEPFGWLLLAIFVVGYYFIAAEEKYQTQS